MQWDKDQYWKMIPKYLLKTSKCLNLIIYFQKSIFMGEISHKNNYSLCFLYLANITVIATVILFCD